MQFRYFIALTLASTFVGASTASAQPRSYSQYGYGRTQNDYYQPRVETRRAVQAPQEVYEWGGGLAGTLGGGAAGARACGPYCAGGGAYIGGKAGEAWGQRQYNSGRYEDRYYSPRAYGTQTTTPYMVRRHN